MSFQVGLFFQVIVRTSPFLKTGEVNFKYLPRSEGESEKLKRGGSMVQGQIFLKRGRGGELGALQTGGVWNPLQTMQVGLCPLCKLWDFHTGIDAQILAPKKEK